MRVLLSILLMIGLLYFVFIFYRNTNIITDERPQLRVDAGVSNKPRVDCNQSVVYCFQDNHCAKLCFNKTGSVCRNGICINTNVLNSQQPLNECNVERGVVTFLVGNTSLGRFDYLCRSIDPGIAPDDITQPNNMCKNGSILIDYTQQFPDIRNCTCPTGTKGVILPATSQVRPYVQCIEEFWADRIL
jgi:hypothetical protein